MTKTPFAKSSPKSALMARLGLHGSAGDDVYNWLYVSKNSRKGLVDRHAYINQAEATYGRDRLSRDPHGLTKKSHQDEARQPYKWDDLQETARHREVLNIVRSASARTRPYYQLGKYVSVEEENWVAEWFLWHSFRFRDNRNHQVATQQMNGNHTIAGGNATHGVTSNAQFWGTVLR